MYTARYALLLLVSLASSASTALAHPGHDHDEDSKNKSPSSRQQSAIRETALATAAQHVRISVRDGYRYIESDGIPDHATGRFPNRGNPNTIRAQRYSFRVPENPQPAERSITRPLGPFGIAINGVPFDPGANEWWRNDRSSGWQYEALSGKIDLGFDANRAHVQPTGAYHYHGIPTGLIEKLGGNDKNMLLLGYAADGYPIYAPQAYTDPKNPQSALKQLQSSYRVKKGARPSGPGGSYDGTFVQDYEYVAGAGDLDEFNGRTGVTPEYPKGTFYYVITEDYPFIPRTFRGTPDSSFERRGPPPGGPGGPGGPFGPPGGPPGGNRPPRPLFGPPEKGSSGKELPPF